MSRRRPSIFAALAAVVLAAATVVGAAHDPRPAPVAQRRAGYDVVEADLHVHTRFSDGFLSPLDVVVHARRQGLGAIALTEHNVVFPAKMARAWSRLLGGPEVIVGEEITTADHHLLALGLERAVEARLPLRAAIDAVHAQGGVVVAAHPASRFLPSLRAGLDLFDGVEVVHPSAYREARGGWSGEDFEAFLAEVARVQPRVAAIGTSDYHAGPSLGLSTTWIFAEGRGSEALVAAIRAGRTVTVDRHGRMLGDPSLVRAVERDPLERPPRDVAWRGEGWLDRLARVAGSLALLALVLLRRTSGPSES